MDRPARKRGLLGPLVLIGLGVILLLNNLGILSWSVWGTLFHLWPVLLIGFGLDLLVGRQSLVGSMVVVLVVAGIIAVVLWGYHPVQLATNSAEATTEQISEPLKGASKADVQISMGVGNLKLGGVCGPDQLVEGKIALLPGEKAVQDSSMSGDTAVYRLKSQMQPGSGVPIPFGLGASQDDADRGWELRLNGSVPTRLQVNTGVGATTVDLSQLNITDLDIRGGVGRSSITLPGQGTITARVEGGVGEIVVMIPAGMAARIKVNGGLGGMDLPSQYQKQGDNSYVSPGYDTAQNRVDLQVNGGVGRILVEQYQPQQPVTPSSALILPQSAGAES